MAKRIITTTLYQDDLTGAEFDADAIETIRFGLEGVLYEIDLGPENVKKFTKAMQPYLDAARRVGGTKKATRSKKDTKPAEIRQWAIDHGIDVPERGRIPEAVREQYEAAHAA